MYRYEPGVLNVGPILGMRAAMEMFLAVGQARVSERIAGLVARLAGALAELGFEFLGQTEGPRASGILTVSHPRADARELVKALTESGVIASPRRDRAGNFYLRFAPHFYNTEAELDQTVEVLREALPRNPAS